MQVLQGYSDAVIHQCKNEEKQHIFTLNIAVHRMRSLGSEWYLR